MPLSVNDEIAFVTRDGREMRVTARRRAAPGDALPLIWYCASDPRRIATVGPLAWFGWSLASAATLLWLLWS